MDTHITSRDRSESSDPGGDPLVVTVVVGPPEGMATAGYHGIFGASLTSKNGYCRNSQELKFFELGHGTSL
jgi:hypothetical protein